MNIVRAVSGSMTAPLRRVLRPSGGSAESRTPTGCPAAARARTASFARPTPLAGGGGVIFLPSGCIGNPHLHRSWQPRSESSAARRARTGSLSAALGRLVRERRASASIELAIGAVAILAVAAVAFDLYSLTRANAAGARIAATMADYVSRESAPDGDEMAALGRFLHDQEFGMPSTLVYVISAVHQPPGDDDPAVKLWGDDKIRVGEAAEAATLAQECQSRGQSGWQAAVVGQDATLDLKANDVVIVVEVCASLLREGMLSEMVAGNLYRVHALPARGFGGKPAKPAYAPVSEEAAVSRADGIWATASLHDWPDSALGHAARGEFA